MLTLIANLILNILLCTIVCRESKKFSQSTLLICIILGTAAVIIQIISIFYE